VLSTGAALDARVHERFVVRTPALLKLRHAALVAALDAGVDDRVLYVVHELVYGPSLAELVGGEAVGAARIRELLTPIARALAHAHRRGIVHEALGPGSILLDERRGPLLADTGLAWSAHALREGVPGYAAPELGGGSRPTAAADIYALGAIAFWLASGEPPFSPTDADYEIRRRAERARPLSLVAPALAVADPALAALVDELLAPNPRDRPTINRIAGQLTTSRRKQRLRPRWRRRA
jgi:serine/threonine-protein kinase